MLRKICFAAICSIIIFSCRKNDIEVQTRFYSDAITQFGSKQAFLEQKFVGKTQYADIIKEGDFAIGTFNYVDGEMAAIDNNFMRIPVSGKVHRADETLMAPFAVVKFFKSENKISINSEKSMKEIWSITSIAFSDTTKPIAVKVTGNFAYVKARSVHKQKQPFQTMQEIVANQEVFEFENLAGSLIGYWFPKYMDGVNFTGFHFHFLSTDLTKGGHLLDCKIQNGIIEIDYADRLILR